MTILTGYSYRAKGLVKNALLKLGYISTEKHGSRIFYHCRECDKTFPKGSILIHYSTLPKHREIYITLVSLLTIWDLIEREDTSISEPMEMIELTN